MGRLLEIARAALAEAEPHDVKRTDAQAMTLIRANAPIIGRVVDDLDECPCQHCGGSGQCDCMTCGRFETHAVWKPGRCVPCEVSARARIQ